MRNLIWVLACVLVFSAGTLFAQGRPDIFRPGEPPSRPVPVLPPGTTQPIPINPEVFVRLQSELGNLTKMVEQLQLTNRDQTVRIWDMQKRLHATCFLVLQYQPADPSPNVKLARYPKEACSAGFWGSDMRAFFEVPFGG